MSWFKNFRNRETGEELPATWQFTFCAGAEYLPGTLLHHVLQEAGVHPAPGCSCNELNAWMNSLNVEGCMERKPELVRSMMRNSASLGWAVKLQAAWTLMFRISNPLDGYAALVDHAIRESLILQRRIGKAVTVVDV